jgi:hypothetical protein
VAGNRCIQGEDVMEPDTLLELARTWCAATGVTLRGLSRRCGHDKLFTQLEGGEVQTCDRRERARLAGGQLAGGSAVAERNRPSGS